MRRSTRAGSRPNRVARSVLRRGVVQNFPNKCESNFKNWTRIAHRAVMTRNHSPNAPSRMCRCCESEPERFSHIGTCTEIREVFKLFAAFASTLTGKDIDPTPALVFLGLVPAGRGMEFGPLGQKRDGRGAMEALSGGLASLHTIMWKFILIAFTKKDIEGTPFEPQEIWLQTLRRLRVRLKSQAERVRRSVLQRRAGGKLPLPLTAANRWISPLGSYAGPDEDHPGRITLSRPTAQAFKGLMIQLRKKRKDKKV